MTNRRLTATLAAAAVAAAGLAPGLATAGSTQVSPGSGKPMTGFFVKVPAKAVEEANDNGGFSEVRITKPRGSSSNCGVHHPSSDYGVRGGKAVFHLEPESTYAGKWCKGTYSFKVVADKFGDGSSEKTIGSGSFKVR